MIMTATVSQPLSPVQELYRVLLSRDLTSVINPDPGLVPNSPVGAFIIIDDMDRMLKEAGQNRQDLDPSSSLQQINQNIKAAKAAICLAYAKKQYANLLACNPAEFPEQKYTPFTSFLNAVACFADDIDRALQDAGATRQELDPTLSTVEIDRKMQIAQFDLSAKYAKKLYDLLLKGDLSKSGRRRVNSLECAAHIIQEIDDELKSIGQGRQWLEPTLSVQQITQKMEEAEQRIGFAYAKKLYAILLSGDLPRVASENLIFWKYDEEKVENRASTVGWIVGLIDGVLKEIGKTRQELDPRLKPEQIDRRIKAMQIRISIADARAQYREFVDSKVRNRGLGLAASCDQAIKGIDEALTQAGMNRRVLDLSLSLAQIDQKIQDKKEKLYLIDSKRDYNRLVSGHFSGWADPETGGMYAYRSVYDIAVRLHAIGKTPEILDPNKSAKGIQRAIRRALHKIPDALCQEHLRELITERKLSIFDKVRS